MSDLIPGAVFIGLSLCVGLILFWLSPLRQKQRSRLLVQYFNGKFHFLLANISFDYLGAKYCISRISSGRGLDGVGGSYPVLWSYVEDYPLIIMGHKNSGKYTRGKFLYLPPTEIIKEKGLEILVGSREAQFIEKFKLAFADLNFQNDLRELFVKDFHHITISTDWHLSKLQLKKKNVLRFNGLPEEIYQNPELLESQLKSLSRICHKLNIIDSGF